MRQATAVVLAFALIMCFTASFVLANSYSAQALGVTDYIDNYLFDEDDEDLETDIDDEMVLQQNGKKPEKPEKPSTSKPVEASNNAADKTKPDNNSDKKNVDKGKQPQGKKPLNAVVMNENLFGDEYGQMY